MASSRWERISRDWRTLPVTATGLLDSPRYRQGPALVVLAAKVVGVKGLFSRAYHSWVAFKPDETACWLVTEITDLETLTLQGITNFREVQRYHDGEDTQHWTFKQVFCSTRQPDGHWFGSAPKVLAEDLFDDSEGYQRLIRTAYVFGTAARCYPYNGEFSTLSVNCNTYTSWLLWCLRFNGDKRVPVLAETFGYRTPRYWSDTFVRPQ